LVALPQAVSGANYYLAISYNQAGQLAPGASTGAIRYRISKPDGGRFDQTNDYSYQEQPQERSQNSRVVVLVGTEIVWGTPPSGVNARMAPDQEPGTDLSVQVLGNPIQGDQIRVEIRGAQGQPLRLSVSDLSGRVVTQKQIEMADLVEQQSLSVSQLPAGLLLLQVSTPMQSRTIKVLKGQ
ncbi:MAG: T9SS type A sorting domain-containing protein, partial [Cytophagaceae bacterium]